MNIILCYADGSQVKLSKVKNIGLSGPGRVTISYFGGAWSKLHRNVLRIATQSNETIFEFPVIILEGADAMPDYK